MMATKWQMLKCNKSQISLDKYRLCDQSRSTHWCLHAARCRGSHKASSVWWWWGEGREETDMLPTWVGHSGGKISLDGAPRGRDTGERQTRQKEANPQRIWHKQTACVRCNPNPTKEIINKVWFNTMQTDKWVTTTAQNIEAGVKTGLNNNLSLGYSSLKSLLFLVVQSRTFSTLTTISFPCQRPCHSYRQEINIESGEWMTCTFNWPLAVLHEYSSQ